MVGPTCRAAVAGCPCQGPQPDGDDDRGRDRHPSAVHATGIGLVASGAILRDVRAGGAEVALGSIAVLDLEVRDVERELAFVLRRVRPGSVIVLHEGRPGAGRRGAAAGPPAG